MAEINCTLDRIPAWLFYGCDSLQSVTFRKKEQDVQQLKTESEKETEESAEKIPSDRPDSFAGETGTVVAPNEEKDVTQTPRCCYCGCNTR